MNTNKRLSENKFYLNSTKLINFDAFCTPCNILVLPSNSTLISCKEIGKVIPGFKKFSSSIVTAQSMKWLQSTTPRSSVICRVVFSSIFHDD
jgi:hypothetical protein